MTKPNPENCKNCSTKCAYDCAQLQYTIQPILPPDKHHSSDVSIEGRTKAILDQRGPGPGPILTLYIIRLVCHFHALMKMMMMMMVMMVMMMVKMMMMMMMVVMMMMLMSVTEWERSSGSVATQRSLREFLSFIHICRFMCTHRHPHTDRQLLTSWAKYYWYWSTFVEFVCTCNKAWCDIVV